MAAILFSLVHVAPTSAAVVTVYWTGTITDCLYFGGAMPAGVANGAPISGELVFETSQYESHTYINGSHNFSERYRYGGTTSLQFSVPGCDWVISGTDISLTGYSFEPKQAFDVFSTSDRNGPLVFPGYVGAFEAAFALFAEISPYPVFDTSNIDAAVFDFEHPTSGSGFLSTRLFDENDNIVEGYYLGFTISQSSSNPIPEPSVPVLIGTAICAFFSRRFREQIKPNKSCHATRNRFAVAHQSLDSARARA
jgi:hypothetical protein